MARITTGGDVGNLPRVAGAGKTWGPIFPLKPPVNADYAWINQGSATVTDLGDAIALFGPAGTGPNIHLRKKTAPATPYTVEIALLSGLTLNDFYSVGFVWRQSSDGKLVTFHLELSAAACSFAVAKWNSPTSFSATYTSLQPRTGYPLLFLKAQDTGTNRICSFSADGQNWAQLHTVGRTDFMTADEVGFGIKIQNGSLAGGAVMTLVNWKES